MYGIVNNCLLNVLALLYAIVKSAIASTNSKTVEKSGSNADIIKSAITHAINTA